MSGRGIPRPNQGKGGLELGAVVGGCWCGCGPSAEGAAACELPGGAGRRRAAGVYRRLRPGWEWV